MFSKIKEDVEERFGQNTFSGIDLGEALELNKLATKTK